MSGCRDSAALFTQFYLIALHIEHICLYHKVYSVLCVQSNCQSICSGLTTYRSCCGEEFIPYVCEWEKRMSKMSLMLKYAGGIMTLLKPKDMFGNFSEEMWLKALRTHQTPNATCLSLLSIFFLDVIHVFPFTCQILCPQTQYWSNKAQSQIHSQCSPPANRNGLAHLRRNYRTARWNKAQRPRAFCLLLYVQEGERRCGICGACLVWVRAGGGTKWLLFKLLTKMSC